MPPRLTRVQLAKVLFNEREGRQPARPRHHHAAALGVQAEVIEADAAAAAQPLKLGADGGRRRRVHLTCGREMRVRVHVR